MGTLVLAGATSGSTTLTPVDAVTTVLTLPSSTATLATLGANTFAGNQSITGTLGVTGTITPGQTTGIVGTTTNNSAQAGSVGEYIEGVQSAGASLTSTAVSNMITISLTAGDWDVSTNFNFVGAGSTILKNIIVGINTTSSTLPSSNDIRAGQSWGTSGLAIFAQGEYGIPGPTRRISLASTTTIYAVAYADFTVSTLSVYGFISARRVR